MPAIDNTEDPFQYCDANRVGGHWCPEFDIQEANRHAFHATAHKCDDPVEGVYSNCDRSGQCTLDVFYDAVGQYGEGSQYQINTEKEFHVKTEFLEQNGQFYGYRMTMTQEGRELVMETGDCSDYLQHMTSDITNMAFAFSHWDGGSLDWMQHGVCTGGCESTAMQTYSNLQFWTNGSSADEQDEAATDEQDEATTDEQEEATTDEQEAPAQMPDPIQETQYMYDYECTAESGEDMSLCADGCNCHISWALDAPEDTRCRCLPRQRAAEGYHYDEPCVSEHAQAGTCEEGCDCRHSWPLDDALGMGSLEQMCRCKPAAEEPVRNWGGECSSPYDGLCGADCHSCQSNWLENGSSDGMCRCKTENIREIEWGAQQCQNFAGQCGYYCRDCRVSWEKDDTDGSTVDCRCRNWWGY